MKKTALLTRKLTQQNRASSFLQDVSPNLEYLDQQFDEKLSTKRSHIHSDGENPIQKI